MADYPAMPLWTDAYLGDTQHLQLHEHGAYVKLLMIAWRTPDCRLPNDDKRLATMLGVGPKKWLSIKEAIWPFFTEEGNKVFQKRQLKVRAEVEKNVSQKRSAGKASAQSKSLKNNETGSTAVDEPLQRQGQRQANGKSTNQNQNQKEERGGADAQPYAFEGKVIRLKSADFEKWRQAYPNVPDLVAELTAADAYYHENKPKDGKWFFPVSNWLKRANNEGGKPLHEQKAFVPLGVDYGSP